MTEAELQCNELEAEVENLHKTIRAFRKELTYQTDADHANHPEFWMTADNTADNDEG